MIHQSKTTAIEGKAQDNVELHQGRNRVHFTQEDHPTNSQGRSRQEMGELWQEAPLEATTFRQRRQVLILRHGLSRSRPLCTRRKSSLAEGTRRLLSRLQDNLSPFQNKHMGLAPGKGKFYSICRKCKIQPVLRALIEGRTSI